MMLPAILALSLLSPLFCFAPNESEAKVGGHWVFSKKHYKVVTQRDGQKEGEISAKVNGWPLPVEDEPKWIGKEPYQSMLLPGTLMTYEIETSSRKLPTKELSIEAWVAPKSERNFAAIVCASEDNSDDEAGFYLCQETKKGEDRARFAFFLKSEKTVSVNGDRYDRLYSDPIKFGEWYHVVATYDGKTKRLYVNGKLVGKQESIEEGDIHYKEKHTFAVGALKDKDEEVLLDGAIHMVAITGRVLHPNTVTSNYNKLAGKLPPLPWVKTLEPHYVFSEKHYNEDKGVISAKESGDPPLPGVVEPEWIGEGEYQSMLLPDTDPWPMTYKVETSWQKLPKRKISIEAWVAPKSRKKFAPIVWAAHRSGADEAGFYLCQEDDRFTFFLKSEETVGVVSDEDDLLVFKPKGERKVNFFKEWHHVVATYDGKKRTLYVDGDLVASKPGETGDIHYKKVHDFTVGAFVSQDQERALDGAIHMVAIYGEVLSARDVTRSYNKLAGKLPPLLRVKALEPHYVFSEKHYNEDKGEISAMESGDPPLPGVVEPEWIGEGKYQSMLLPDTPMTYKVETSWQKLPTKTISIEAWVAPKSEREFAAIVCAAEDNNDDEAGFYLCQRKGRFSFFLENKKTVNTANSDDDFLFSDPIKFGEWHHVVATYDGREKRLYVNGKLADEARGEESEIHYKEVHDFTVGAFKDKNEEELLDGAVHMVAIYGEVLSARDVTRSYKKLAGKLPPLPRVKALEPAKLNDTFRRRVNQALFLGVEHLLLNQHRDGSWAYRYSNQYRNGATSLAVYTLLKCGLQPDHPAIVKGFEFLEREDPVLTKSAGLQLMALGAAGDTKDNKKWGQRILDKLLEWESAEQSGCFGYPGQPCLANTHFAALGLWGADALNLRMKDEKALWGRILENLVKHQLPDAVKKAKDSPLGFTYNHHTGDRGKETTPMTVAGLTMIGLAEELEVPHRKLNKAKGQAFAFLESRYPAMLKEADRVAGWAPGNLHYSYFGLEHIGALFEIEKIGEHDWYLDGAEELIKSRNEEPFGISGVPWQPNEGPWGNDIQTCFALLFLRKASHEVHFGDAINRAVRQQRDFQEDKGDVHLRVQRLGEKKAVLSIDGFSDEFMLRYEDPQNPSDYGLLITKVTYRVDGEEVEPLSGDTQEAWISPERSGAYDVEYEFLSPGYHFVQVDVEVLPPNVAPEPRPVGLPTFKSRELRVVSCAPSEAWMESCLDQKEEEDLLFNTPGVAVYISSESQHNELAGASDGLHSTRWVCKETDDNPWIKFDFPREERIKPKRLRLSQANSSFAMRGYYGAIQKFSVSVNGGNAEEHTFPDSVISASSSNVVTVDLGKFKGSLRKLRIQILKATPGTYRNKEGSPVVGFSYIELFN